MAMECYHIMEAQNVNSDGVRWSTTANSRDIITSEDDIS
jgi:hypothetical protein